tara:strand:+ start:594 stop:1865 length:1272 start_codon:yes stop_codon:yes gene_type:complete
VGNPGSLLPRDWQWTRLTDVARLESGHTPSRSKPEYWGGDIPWIGIRDATGNHGRTIFETNENTNALGIANSSARVLPKETVCLSRTASVGYVVVMGKPMSTSQDFVNWVCEDELNPNFLKYALLAEQRALHMYSVGSVHSTIYFPEVKAFHIALPGRNTQDGIVDVLSALDDKIELNRRTNETLEAMAQAIFKDWFVDFGPVRRKMQGETNPTAILGGLIDDPAKAGTLATLFPDTLGANGLPEGWSEGRLQDVTTLSYGKSLPKRDRKDGPYKVYGSGGASGSHDKALVNGPGIIVGRKGTVGSLFWEPSDFFPIDTVFYSEPVSPYSLVYIWYLLGTLPLAAMNTDAAVPGLNRDNAYRLGVALTNEALVRRFTDIVAPIRARIDAHDRESQILAETRDYLLPKLMSGNVRVAAIEKELA